MTGSLAAHIVSGILVSICAVFLQWYGGGAGCRQPVSETEAREWFARLKPQASKFKSIRASISPGTAHFVDACDVTQDEVMDRWLRFIENDDGGGES